MTSKFFPRRNNVKCGSHCKECEKEKESKRIRIPSFNENGELLRKLTIEIDFYHDCYLDVKLEYSFRFNKRAINQIV